MRSPRSRVPLVAASVALGLLSSACVKPNAPTVGMSKVEASLVFGVSDVPEPVVTPVQEAMTQVAAVAAVADEPEVEEPAPTFEFQKPKVPLLRAPSTTAKPVCPTAPITAAAEVAPQPRISAPVSTGTSKWRVLGFFTGTVDGSGEPARQDLAETAAEPRVVRNVKQIDANKYTFEVVQPQTDGFGNKTDNLMITTYAVNTAGVNVNPSDGVGTVTTPGVGEPERGIVIRKIQIVNRETGQQVSSFDPTVGLLVLPLPVVAGETFQSTAVDPRTGQTITHDSVVVGRERIDACGDLVDGWKVTSKERSTFGQSVVDAGPALSVEADVASIFATQYGGVPIFESYGMNADQGCGICPFEVQFRLGQLHPDPLPSS